MSRARMSKSKWTVANVPPVRERGERAAGRVKVRRGMPETPRRGGVCCALFEKVTAGWREFLEGDAKAEKRRKSWKKASAGCRL